MKDKPIVRLIARRSLGPEAAEWLHKCEDFVNHAVNVTYREEWELAQVELREAMVQWALFGVPIDTEGIVDRFTKRITQRAH